MKAKTIKISVALACLAIFLFSSNQYEYRVFATEIMKGKCNSLAKKNKIPSDCFHNKNNAKNAYGSYLFKERLFLLKSKTLFKLPPNYFKKASCIKNLNLNYNDFSAIPKAIQNLEELENLTIFYNKIKHFKGTSLKENRRLKTLRVDYNEMKTIDLNELINLDWLNISNNNITKIKPIQNAFIKKIIFRKNNLQDFPHALKDVNGLADLDLSFNSISSVSDSLVGDLSQFKALTSINLMNNDLRNFPTALGRMPQLQELFLGKNNLSGNIEIKGFNALKSLSIEHQTILDFTIAPNSFENLTKILFSGNQISNFDIQNELVNLLVMDLSDNQFTTIPSSIYQLKNLEELNLSNNQLKTLHNLETLHNLSKLYLYKNELVSLKGIKWPVSLTELDLSNNFDLKSIPTSFFDNLPNLKKLDIRLTAIPYEDIRKLEIYLKENNRDIRLVY